MYTVTMQMSASVPVIYIHFSLKEKNIYRWWIISSWFSCLRPDKLHTGSSFFFLLTTERRPDHIQIIYARNVYIFKYEFQTTCIWYIISMVHTSQQTYPAQCSVERSCGDALPVIFYFGCFQVEHGNWCFERIFPPVTQKAKVRVHKHTLTPLYLV